MLTSLRQEEHSTGWHSKGGEEEGRKALQVHGSLGVVEGGENPSEGGKVGLRATRRTGQVQNHTLHSCCVTWAHREKVLGGG